MLAELTRRLRDGLTGRFIGACVIGALLSALAIAGTPGSADDTTADLVLGQADFNHNTFNSTAPGSLTYATGAVVDAMGHLYIADATNNRVLGWRSATGLSTDEPADLVIGQPNGSSNACVIGPAGLCLAPCISHPPPFVPKGASGAVAVDSAGNLYVADTCNNRVLEYTAPFNSGLSAGQAANLVFGQSSATASVCSNGLSGNPAPSATGLCAPAGVGVDPAGNLYVGDTGNNRALEYNSPLAPPAPGGVGDTIADLVFGQNGSFSSAGCNSGTADGDSSGLGPDSLCDPTAIALDSNGDLYVADTGNNRVLEYNTPLVESAVIGSGDEIADLVFGQSGSFTTNQCNAGATTTASASTLCNPAAVTLDTVGRLYIGDTANSRILEFDTPLANPAAPNDTADLVFGQAGDLTTRVCNNSTTGSTIPNPDCLCGPEGVAADTMGNLYVADTLNNRALKFDQPLPTGTPGPSATPTASSTPTAQPTPTPTAPGATATASATPTPTPTAAPTDTPTPTADSTPTASPSPSPAATTSATPTVAASATPIATPTIATPTPLATPAPSPTPNPITITITAPASGTIYTLNEVVLAGYSCADSVATVATCAGPVANGAAIDTSTPGPQTFVVSATDNSGNSALEAVTYTVSATPAPAITITTPAANTIYGLNQVVLASYSCTASGGTIVACAGTVANGAAIDTSSLGVQNFTVSALDSNDNSATQSVTYFVSDRLPPTITITAPTHSIYGLFQVVNARYSCTDPSIPVATCTGSVANGSPIDTTSLGSKTFVVTTTDVDGDGTSQMVTYFVSDLTPPAIVISSPTDGSYGLGQTVQAAYSCTDPSATLTSCSGTVPNGADIDTSSIGQQVFEVTAADDQGNAAAQHVTYSVIPITPTSLSFGPQLPGTVSAPQSVQVIGVGPADQGIGFISATGPFRKRNRCPAAIAPGTQCPIEIRFAPESAGTHTGKLTVVEGQTALVVNLNGVATRAALSPAALSFRRRSVGSTSAAKKITLANNHGSRLELSGIAVTGDFAETDHCGTQLAPHASCKISVTFTPAATGKRLGTLTVNANAPLVHQTVTLTGTGI